MPENRREAGQIPPNPLMFTVDTLTAANMPAPQPLGPEWRGDSFESAGADDVNHVIPRRVTGKAPFDTHFIFGFHSGFTFPRDVHNALTAAEQEGNPFNLVIFENAPARDQRKAHGFQDSARYIERLRSGAMKISQDTGIPIDTARDLQAYVESTIRRDVFWVEDFDPAKVEAGIRAHGLTDSHAGLIKSIIGHIAMCSQKERPRLAGYSRDQAGYGIFKDSINIAVARHDVKVDVVEGNFLGGEGLDEMEVLKAAGEITQKVGRRFMNGEPLESLIGVMGGAKSALLEKYAYPRDRAIVAAAPSVLAGYMPAGGRLKTLFVYGGGHAGMVDMALGSEKWRDHDITVIESSSQANIVGYHDPIHAQLIYHCVQYGLMHASPGDKPVLDTGNISDVGGRIKGSTRDDMRRIDDKIAGLRSMVRCAVLLGYFIGPGNVRLNLTPEQKMWENQRIEPKARKKIPKEILSQLDT